MTGAEGENATAPFALVAAVNDEAVLARDLAASPDFDAVERHIVRGARCMGAAYNAGIDATTAPVIVFTHQDVYLPEGWLARLATAIRAVEAHDPHWGVIGLIGTTQDGPVAGRIWSSGLGREVPGKASAALPVPAQSLDELVLVLRRASGLRFDPDLPHFHLYGTDIVQIALQAGQGAWIVDAPVIHNSDQLSGLGRGYWQAYTYLRRKWTDRLPIVTPIVPVEPGWRGLLRSELWIRRQLLRQRLKGRPPRVGHPDPAALARQLGYAGADRPAPAAVPTSG